MSELNRCTTTVLQSLNRVALVSMLRASEQGKRLSPYQPRAFAFATRLYDSAGVLLESSEGIFY